MHTKQKGFTLIELLVVVAIIGLLASIVIASLNSARQKGRDARRVADIRSIQQALEMFNDANFQYPTATSGITTYMGVVPNDPAGGSYVYRYAGIGGTTCPGYHLGATLEVTGSPSLNSAAHATSSTACSGTSQTPTASYADFTCSGVTQCYDVKGQ